MREACQDWSELYTEKAGPLGRRPNNKKKELNYLEISAKYGTSCADTVPRIVYESLGVKDADALFLFGRHFFIYCLMYIGFLFVWFLFWPQLPPFFSFHVFESRNSFAIVLCGRYGEKRTNWWVQHIYSVFNIFKSVFRKLFRFLRLSSVVFSFNFGLKVVDSVPYSNIYRKRAFMVTFLSLCLHLVLTRINKSETTMIYCASLHEL